MKTLVCYYTEAGIDAFNFWPVSGNEQIRLFAQEEENRSEKQCHLSHLFSFLRDDCTSLIYNVTAKVRHHRHLSVNGHSQRTGIQRV